MTATFLDFTPSILAPFSFQPTFGTDQYVVVVTWNVSGQRFYVNVYDLSGDLIVCRGLVETGPVSLATIIWDGVSTATATLGPPHYVPPGAVASIWVSRTGSGFDGGQTALSTGPYTLTFPLVSDPGVAQPASGAVQFPLNLVDGYIPNGWLLYHADTNQFEW